MSYDYNFSLSQIDLTKHPECQHLPFVLYVAKSFIRHRKNFSIDDFINIGYLVLKKCEKSYDPTLGVKFVAYLHHALRHAFQEFIEESLCPVHVPKSSRNCAKRLAKGDTTNCIGAKGKIKNSISQACRFRSMVQETNVDRANNVKSHELELEEQEEQEKWSNDLTAALEKLTEQQQVLLRMYYGPEPMTFDDIGKSFLKRRTRQAVHIAHAKAIKVLRELMRVA